MVTASRGFPGAGVPTFPGVGLQAYPGILVGGLFRP